MNATVAKNQEVKTRTIRPYYSTSEEESSYQVRVYMPGVGKEGIGIELENGELTISGTKFTAKNPEGWRELSRESNSADYRLRLVLNVEINAEKIEAETQNGVLTLTLPKAETSKPRKIEIR